jgi:hypothetical protein
MKGVTMKRFFDWQVILGAILIILSAVVYFIHYLIFRDAHHIFIYLVGDIAFVFLEVLFVTLIIHRLLTQREKQAILKKLNMAIGTFFNEAGTELLKICSDFDHEAQKITRHFLVTKDWSDKEFVRVRTSLKKYDARIDSKKGDLAKVRDFLTGRRQLLLNLLQNPNLLEHECFTNLLWAVFHLADELAHRTDLGRLPDTDYQHLAGDIKRAYNHLILEWLDYMKHLKKNYPYLFSLAMRTNPFDVNASVEVT